MKRALLAMMVAFACVTFLAPKSALSAAPQLINYQGMLTDKDGKLLNGTYDLTFTLYDAATGSNNKWSETHTGVKVTEGLFNVLLGSVNTNSLQLVFSFNHVLYLEIQVGGETLSPRVQIGSAGYAMYAESAAISATTLSAPNTALAFGNIAQNGTINKASPNVTHCIKTETGRYDITIAGETINNTDYVTVVTVGHDGAAYCAYTSSDGGKLVVGTTDATTPPVPKDNDFQFVIYKP